MTIPAPFALANVDWNRDQEYALLLEAVAGEAVITLGPTFPTANTTPTGLANDATAYTMDVVTDAGTSNISVVGSAAQTMADLITEIDADFGGGETIELVGDIIVITSAATGPTSFVTVTDTGANPLLASLGQTGSAGWGVVSNKSYKGNNRYLRWDKMGHVMQNHLDTVVDEFLAAATANTNVKWTSGSDAISFPTGSPTFQTATGLVRSTVYSLNVVVDGVATLGNDADGELFIDLDITELGSATISFQHLLQAINNALVEQGFGAFAAYDAGSPLTLRVSSNAVGTSSSVAITDGAVNPLLTALAAFGPVNAPNETAAVATAAIAGAPAGTVVPALTNATYDVDVTFETGGLQQLAVALLSTDDYDGIAAKIDAPLTNGTCTFANGAFVFTSAVTGLTSTALVAAGTAGSGGGDLFAAITAQAAGNPAVTFPTPTVGTDADGVDGTTNVSFPVTKASVVWDNWNEVLLNWKSPTGFGPLFTSGSAMVFEREDKPAARGDAVETAVYWDGTDWRYYESDAVLDDGTAANPPEA